MRGRAPVRRGPNLRGSWSSSPQREMVPLEQILEPLHPRVPRVPRVTFDDQVVLPPPITAAELAQERELHRPGYAATADTAVADTDAPPETFGSLALTFAIGVPILAGEYLYTRFIGGGRATK